MMNTEKLFARSEFIIKPYDIDAAGHVNNAVYLNWLEDLRIKLFEQFLPLKSLLKNNFYPAVASTEIHYKFPLHLGDAVDGIITVDNFAKGIWYLNAQINSGDKVIVKVKQKCVIIDLKTNKMLNAKEIVAFQQKQKIS